MIALVDIQELANQEDKDRCQREALHFSLAALKFAVVSTALFEKIDQKKTKKNFQSLQTKTT